MLTKEPSKLPVEDTDVFSFNNKFVAKGYKVKLAIATATKESEPAKDTTRGYVEADRKPIIDAAIVRIMKARKTMALNDIVAEVTQQLHSRFKPDPTAIKKQLE